MAKSDATQRDDSQTVSPSQSSRPPSRAAAPSPSRETAPPTKAGKQTVLSVLAPAFVPTFARAKSSPIRLATAEGVPVVFRAAPARVVRASAALQAVVADAWDDEDGDFGAEHERDVRAFQRRMREVAMGRWMDERDEWVRRTFSASCLACNHFEGLEGFRSAASCVCKPKARRRQVPCEGWDF